MLSLNNGEKTNGLQKFFAFGLMAAVAWGAVKLFNYIMPDINEMFENLWKFALVGVPMILIVMYCVFNPLVVWGFFKTLSWKFTSWLIKMDPLSVMDRYVDLLKKKRANLQKTKLSLQANRQALERSMLELEGNIRDNLKRGAAAQEQGQTAIASVAGTKATTDNETLALYRPILEKLKKNCEFLEELDENWGVSIDKLSYTVDQKRKEYVTLKKMADVLGQAKEFANGESDAKKLYDQSVAALEESVTSKIATIEEFEKNSRTILGEMRVDKKVKMDEGLAAIDKYRKSGALNLDSITVEVPTQTIDFQEVKKVPSKFTFGNKS